MKQTHTVDLLEGERMMAASLVVGSQESSFGQAGRWDAEMVSASLNRVLLTRSFPCPRRIRYQANPVLLLHNTKTIRRVCHAFIRLNKSLCSWQEASVSAERSATPCDWCTLHYGGHGNNTVTAELDARRSPDGRRTPVRVPAYAHG